MESAWDTAKEKVETQADLTPVGQRVVNAAITSHGSSPSSVVAYVLTSSHSPDDIARGLIVLLPTWTEI